MKNIRNMEDMVAKCRVGYTVLDDNAVDSKKMIMEYGNAFDKLLESDFDENEIIPALGMPMWQVARALLDSRISMILMEKIGADAILSIVSGNTEVLSIPL